MKYITEKEAIRRLDQLKTSYRQTIRENYEQKAKDCLTCETKGACCLDAHFVNVHITRLEAVAMRKVLDELSRERQDKLAQKIEESIENYNLQETGDTFLRTYACPLFDREVGCLVHAVKPAACIQHACYQSADDLPPDALLDQVEQKIDRLNGQTYRDVKWLPIPVWLQKL